MVRQRVARDVLHVSCTARHVDPTDETLDVRMVETGLSNWAHTEIISGLSVSERIVLSTEREGLEQGVLLEAEEGIAP